MNARRSMRQGVHAFLEETGALTRFTGRFFIEVVKERQEYAEFIRQCVWVGYKLLPLVGITGFIMGLVLTIQSRPTLVEFGAEAMLPSMVALSLVREISPVITALICAGKVGSGMGAELGFMLIHGKCYADDTLERLEKTEDKEIKEFFCL